MILVVGLVINEVSYMGGDSGWVELYNDQGVNLNLHEFTLGGVRLQGSIAPGEYLVFRINLRKDDYTLRLVRSGTLVDSCSWVSLPDIGSLGRYPDATGDFRPFTIPTPGRKNEVPSSLDENSWGKIKALFSTRKRKP